MVGHHLRHDIRILKKALGLDVASVLAIVAVLDTQQMARCVFNFQHKYISLHRTLMSLGIRAIQLHNSGNDAVYTLKAALLLFCNYQRKRLEEAKLDIERGARNDPSVEELSWEERLDIVKRIANNSPQTVFVRERRQAARQPKPPRSKIPDLLHLASNPGGEVEDILIFVFGGSD